MVRQFALAVLILLAWAGEWHAWAQLPGEEVERGSLPALTTPPAEPEPAPAPAGPAEPPDQGPPTAQTEPPDQGPPTAQTEQPGGAPPTSDGTESAIAPQIWRLNPALTRPDLTSREPIKVLVGNDYPPFNYHDESGALVGFNVDLARAMCLVLRVKCTVNGLAWDRLVPSLLNGTGDALIASMRITSAALRNVDFTKPYFRLPARFAVRKDAGIETVEGNGLPGKRIGVVRGTAHEAYLAAFFPRSVVRLYTKDSEALEALRAGQVDAVFADGATLMFWTLSASSADCCRLAPGAFTEARYFGTGAGIAVRRGDTPLRNGFEYAMDQLKANGTYDMLLRKYFPANLY
ncbi:transporter substrate-binding domain-containing protein [Rhodoligotrophos defluvii]|uniref:transporter substrate-binding domain-containing protein n=1 Tax=Rhodoligotrophos defluvii TaxID=2561934 RepID=UPI0010C994AD|nr:transporter substrate-binding domain-containing protein [Rhodoligotrophos defluvii]